MYKAQLYGTLRGWSYDEQSLSSEGTEVDEQIKATKLMNIEFMWENPSEVKKSQRKKGEILL